MLGLKADKYLIINLSPSLSQDPIMFDICFLSQPLVIPSLQYSNTPDAVKGLLSERKDGLND